MKLLIEIEDGISTNHCGKCQFKKKIEGFDFWYICELFHVGLKYDNDCIGLHAETQWYRCEECHKKEIQ